LAEKAKDEGNQFMKEKKYKEAIESYKKAIGFNPRNAIYPSNMAAAYINMGDYDNGIKCCKKSVEIDPTFHKAYARLGAVYDRQGKLDEAVAQYKLALQHSPGNKEYETKVSTLERELNHPQQQGNPFANLGNMFGGGQGGGMPDMSQLLGGLGGGQGGGMPDIGSLLGNPQFMNMAMNMMQQPGMQEMMQGMMQNMGMGSGMMGGQGPSEEQHQAAMDKILQDPEVQENPRLKEIFTKAREGGPQSMLEYVNDPEVSQFMMKYAQKHVDMSQLQNMFGNAFGGGSRDDRDDDSNSGMYS
jgi:small glutamine-rich tetratricopeptide repeat-containing protein alpha